MAEPTAAFFYSPGKIDYLLRHWLEIVALAETPQSARGLLQPGETREAPRLKRPKGYHGDALAWACVVADVEHAWYGLLGEGETVEERLRWFVVGKRLSGLPLGQVALLARRRKEDVLSVYEDACLRMAVMLGYRPPVDDDLGDELS